MKTIVIIDDEYHFRQALNKYICDYKNEYIVIGEAYNGVDGTALINRLHPDIVLLDISMPQKDGFSVIQETKDKNKKTKFVIISGYEKFEYAQKAIKFGVKDFLLKPITAQNLYECLQEVSQNIDYEQTLEETLSAFTKKEHRNKSYLSSVFIRKIINESHTTDELMQFSREIQFPIVDCYFEIASLSLQQNNDTLSAKTLDIYSFAIENILNELLRINYIQCLCTTNNNFLLLLLSIPTHTRHSSLDIKEAFHKLTSIINKNGHFFIIISFDNCCRTVAELSASYKNIMQLQEYCLFYSLNGIHDFPSYINSIQTALLDSPFRENHLELFRCIRINNYLGIIANCRSIFASVQQQKPGLDNFFQYFQRLLVDISSIFEEYNIVSRTPLTLKEFEKYRTLNEIQTAFIDVLSLLSRAITNPAQPSNHVMIVKIKNYIREHYNQPEIGPHSLSEIFNLNEQHLCFLFKKHTNYTIGNYILNIRMQAAKKMLDESNYNISEISEKIGYNDTGYFSKCFKKYYGLSPKHYLTKN